MVAVSLIVAEGENPSPQQIVEARNQYLKWCGGCRTFHPEKAFADKGTGKLRSLCRKCNSVKNKAYRERPGVKERLAASLAVSKPKGKARLELEARRQRFLERQKLATKGKTRKEYVRSKPEPAVCAEQWTLGNHWCGGCKAFRPKTEFTKCTTTPSGLQNRCRQHA